VVKLFNYINMIRKIFLFVWCLCIFSLTKAATSNKSNILSPTIQKDSLDSIKFFPSVEVYFGLLGSIPFTSLNFEPTILESNNYFINLRLSHSYWYDRKFYFFQTSLLAGIKANSHFSFYGGLSFKASRTSVSLKNAMEEYLLANAGVEYITRFNILIKIGFNKDLFELKPTQLEGFYDIIRIPYSIGIGYLICNNKNKNNHINKVSYFPKNTLSLTYGLQYPKLLLRYEHQLYHIGKYALLTNIGYRYGKYRCIHNTNNYEYLFKSDMKNIQLGLDFKTIIIPHVSWYIGFTNGYYYVVDNDNPSYFNEIAIQTGLCFLLGKHLQIKYYVDFPFYYHNIRPTLRTQYYWDGSEYISTPKISIGYSFGYKKY